MIFCLRSKVCQANQGNEHLYPLNMVVQGHVVDAGVYTYKIYIELNDGELIKNQGAITLIR